MKRVFAILVLISVSIFAFAQKSDIPSQIFRNRVEIAESSDENTTPISVFYMYDESPRMYYLSVGDLGVGTDLLQVNFDPVYELFIPLGGTIEEAVAKLNEIKALYKMPRRESVEMQANFAPLYPNGELITVTVTSRQILLGKALEFSIPTGSEGVVRATHIYRSDLFGLVTALKIYKKLHPRE